MKLSEHLSTTRDPMIVCPCGCGFGTRQSDFHPSLPILFESIREEANNYEKLRCENLGISYRELGMNVLSGARCLNHQMAIKEINSKAATFSPHVNEFIDRVRDGGPCLALDLQKPITWGIVEFYSVCSMIVARQEQGGCGLYWPEAGNFVHVDIASPHFGPHWPSNRRWEIPKGRKRGVRSRRKRAGVSAVRRG